MKTPRNYFNHFVLTVVVLIFSSCDSPPADPPASGAFLVAHRGASAYAPEHTLPAYELAIEQGADFIEPDLQITKDGHLIALHDVTLERTTDVQERFPERFREVQDEEGRTQRHWAASDFSLAEIKQLDAGSWFSEDFRGARVPTLHEVIELARGRAGLYPETKAPEVYASLGFEMENLLLNVLADHGLDRLGADSATPVVIQSFSEESLRILAEEIGTDLPLTFLVSGRAAEPWVTAAGLERVSGFASAIGPSKGVIEADTSLVTRAHEAGLAVVPWTFRSSETVGYQAVRDEMTRFVCVLGVDGLFTNNPDLFPRSCE